MSPASRAASARGSEQLPDTADDTGPYLSNMRTENTDAKGSSDRKGGPANGHGSQAPGCRTSKRYPDPRSDEQFASRKDLHQEDGAGSVDRQSSHDEEATSEETSSQPSPSDEDDSQCSSNEDVSSEGDEPDQNEEISGSGAGGAAKNKRAPSRISGRRGLKGSAKVKDRKQSLPFRPELVLKRAQASPNTWEIALSTDEELPLAAVHLEGRSLELTSETSCHVRSFNGTLTASSQDGQRHTIPLFQGEPLIFKLRKNWKGDGRKIAKVTKGYFIMITPRDWERSGPAPVEPGSCIDQDFRAHFFYRDPAKSDGVVDGFPEWNNAYYAIGIELTGQSAFDDSDEGALFVGDAPGLKCSSDIHWARIGDETENGWGCNFQPHRQPLQEVLNGREGRFFLRVYDSDVHMLDSVTFRHLRDLRQIQVNGREYAQNTFLPPASTGYPATTIRFAAANNSTLFAELGADACQKTLPSGVLEAPPHPIADRVTCRLTPNTQGVSIVIDLPRLWWQLSDSEPDSDFWRDTPLVLTREEFRRRAHANAAIYLLSRRFNSVQAGFDGEAKQPYRRSAEEDSIVIPLAHFVDHSQIDQRLNRDAYFDIELAREAVQVIKIAADPMPEIVSFTAKPSTVVSGEESILKWTTRNVGEARLALFPDGGWFENDGACSVRPAETTRYTIVVSAPGLEDIKRTVTVTVAARLVARGKHLAPCVLSSAGTWRSGKGFGIQELRDAGLTVREAVNRSIRIDRRRRTVHPENISKIRSMLDV